jgi:hypothetical protein
MAEPARAGWRRWAAPVLAAAAVVVLAVAVWTALDTDPRPVATVHLTSEPEVVTIECGLRSAASTTEWGEAGNDVCEPVETAHALWAGQWAVLATAIGFAASTRFALSGRGRRLVRGTAALTLVAAVPLIAVGAFLDPDPGQVARLPAGGSAAWLPALDGLGVVDAFQVVELRPTAGGVQTGEEVWFLLDATVEETTAALDGLGCATEAVTADFDDGWVDARTTASAEKVDVGTVARALDEEADPGPNARRLLAAAPPATTIVHVATPRFPGTAAPGCPF